MKTKKQWYERLLGTSLLILAAGTLAAACGDSASSSSCEFGETREFACGSDKMGSQPQTCVDGQWYSTSFCRLPDGSHHPDDDWGEEDDCVDGATRAATCGEGNRGLRPELCQGGVWTPTNACTYGGGGTEPPNNGNNDPNNGNNDPNPNNGNNGPDPNNCTTFEQLDRPVSGDTTLDGCYEADNGLSVSRGVHLTVKPGTIIRFGENSGLDVNQGKLTAEGTAENGILFEGKNSLSGYWNGVRIGNSVSIDNSLKYVTIDGGGNNDNFNNVKPANLMVGEFQGRKTKVALEHVTLTNSASYGLYVDADAELAEFSDITITKSAKAAVRIASLALSGITSDNTYSDNEPNAIEVFGSTRLKASITISDAGVPYHIMDDIGIISENNTLTIEPGATLKFNEDTGISVTSSAVLNAVGTSENPITFEGINPTPGFWRGVKVGETTARGNQLEYVVIDGGGSSENFNNIKPANLMVGEFQGRKTKVILKNIVLKNSATYGLYADKDAELVDFSNNKLTENALGAARVAVQALGGLDDESDYSGNTVDAVVVYESNLDSEATWKGLNVPYHVTEDIKVFRESGKLTIEPGATFKFEEDKGLQVVNDARISAVGTDSDPIVFEGLESSPGFWRGIRIGDTRSSSNRLEHVKIDGGGSSERFNYVEPANLMLGEFQGRETAVTLEQVTLSNSAAAELYIDKDTELRACTLNGVGAGDVDGDGTAHAVDVCSL